MQEVVPLADVADDEESEYAVITCGNHGEFMALMTGVA